MEQVWARLKFDWRTGNFSFGGAPVAAPITATALAVHISTIRSPSAREMNGESAFEIVLRAESGMLFSFWRYGDRHAEQMFDLRARLQTVSEVPVTIAAERRRSPLGYGGCYYAATVTY
jgi:hypothetical protein